MENQPETAIMAWHHERNLRIVSAAHARKVVAWSNRGEINMFRIREDLIPDFLYGYSNVAHAASLLDDGNPDDLRDSILSVVDDSLRSRAKTIRDVLKFYGVETMEFLADFAAQNLHVIAKALRPPLQIDGVMTNKHVRKAMTGSVAVKVEARTESVRRVADNGEIINGKDVEYTWREKTFTYQDGHIAKATGPWKPGSMYDENEYIDFNNPSSQRHILEWWGRGEPEERSDQGRTPGDRIKARASLSPRDRAYQQNALRR